MFNPKASRFLRISIDLEPGHASKTDELIEKGGFPTRRSVIEAAIDVLHSCYRLKRRGLRLRGVDPRTNQSVEIDPTNLPRIEGVPEQRRIAIRANEATVRTLIGISKSLRDRELSRVTNQITAEVWDPAKTSPSIEAETSAELVYLARTIDEPELLGAVRDLFATTFTPYKSFHEMLEQSVHGYRPNFDTQFLEQRFLDDEYRRELFKRYPAEISRLQRDNLI